MLLINQKNGVFEIEGKLINTNSDNLKSHFELLLSIRDNTILNLDKLEEIDVSGIQSIIDLYKKAIKTNKAFSIIGTTNKKVWKKINNSKLKYIIKNDFV